MTGSVPILMLHEVSARPDPRYRKYTLTPRELEQRLDWLRANGYESVSMDDLHAARRGEGTLPSQPVAITFDDGGRDCIEHAVPALVQRRCTATFFIVAGVVGGPMRWLQAELGFELPAADWPELRAAESAGMHCEAHSVTHPRLATLTADACRDELTRSRDMLEEGLGHPVRHLAYPFGSHSAETIALARGAGYLTACTTDEALATPAHDDLALPRVPVLGTETLGEFAHRVRTAQRAGPLRLELERVARRFGLPTGRPRS
jgi:peptidoglycan/xylan/chitin deacetylase (PgdA/CDA1 family)